MLKAEIAKLVITYKKIKTKGIECFLCVYDKEGNDKQHTIWTGIIFEMSQIEHMAPASPIINDFFMESGVHFPQSTMNNN